MSDSPLRFDYVTATPLLQERALEYETHYNIITEMDRRTGQPAAAPPRRGVKHGGAYEPATFVILPWDYSIRLLYT